MPQMSPMWWTVLMMLFITCKFIFMTNLFFNFKMKPTIIKNKFNQSMNWKW